MSDILRSRLTDPARIERECARLRSQVPKVQDKVATAIAGILSLWRADDYEAALFSAQQARKTNPKSGDINCVLGQCYLKIRPAKPDEAEKAFRQSFTLGCGRPELIPNWLEAKRLMRDWPGISELAGTANPTEIRSKSAVIVIQAMIELARQADGRDDVVRACGQMREAMMVASRTIGQGRAGDQLAEVREYCRTAAQSYVQLAARLHIRPGDRIDVFNAALAAFSCHITETWMIDLALESIGDWATDAVTRRKQDWEALDILQRRTDELINVRKHIYETGDSRLQLLKRIDGTLDVLSHRIETMQLMRS